jgi:hypothetical protein
VGPKHIIYFYDLVVSAAALMVAAFSSAIIPKTDGRREMSVPEASISKSSIAAIKPTGANVDG